LFEHDRSVEPEGMPFEEPPSDQVQGHAEALVPYLSMNKQSYVFAVTRELVGEGG
jgi:hypothetical protein